MIKNLIREVVEPIGEAARRLLTSPATLLLAGLLYGLMVGAIFLFLTTRESSPVQVFLGLVVYPLIAVFLFFLGQSLGLTATRIGVGVGYKFKRAIIDCSKVIVISIPLLLIMIGVFDGLENLEFMVAGRIEEAAEEKVKFWSGLLIGLWWLKAGLFAIFFPLWAIHWWMVAVREGALVAIRSTGSVMRRALSPGSVLVYLLTTGIFGGLALLVFRLHPPIESEWIELYFFGGRMIVGLGAIFLGWLLTLASLAEWTNRRQLPDA